MLEKAEFKENVKYKLFFKDLKELMKEDNE